MLIQATSYTRNVGYENHLAQKYGAGTPAFTAAAATVDRVTISDAGRAMSRAVSEAADPDHYFERPVSATGELPALPLFSYGEASKLAEAGLKEAMRQLGIPPDSKLSISFGNDGTISIEGAGDKSADLEALVNENMDLHNMLNIASNAAYMERIGQAQSQAAAAVSRNPAIAERANAWLAGVARTISSMGFDFSFSDGALTGSFISNGSRIGLTENLERFAG